MERNLYFCFTTILPSPQVLVAINTLDHVVIPAVSGKEGGDISFLSKMASLFPDPSKTEIEALECPTVNGLASVICWHIPEELGPCIVPFFKGITEAFWAELIALPTGAFGLRSRDETSLCLRENRGKGFQFPRDILKGLVQVGSLTPLRAADDVVIRRAA